MNILEGVSMFKKHDVLAGKYFLDISNADSDTSTDMILHRLFTLGYKPIYDTFREVNMLTGITSATWRVYFLSRTCPPPLVVNGSVCNYVLFDIKLHPAHGKNAPHQSERLPHGYRSLHGIDLLTSDQVFPQPTSPTVASGVPISHTQTIPTKHQQHSSSTQRSSAKTSAKLPSGRMNNFSQATKTNRPNISLQQAVQASKARK